MIYYQFKLMKIEGKKQKLVYNYSHIYIKRNQVFIFIKKNSIHKIYYTETKNSW